MENIVNELLDRPLSFVTRWHNRPNNGLRESVAEHSAWVTRIASLLGNLCTQRDKINWKLLYETALFHDDVEIFTGDIPGAFKHKFTKAKNDIKSWEVFAASNLFLGLPKALSDNYRKNILDYINRPKLPKLELRLVHAADVLTALSYAKTQVEMGNALFKDVMANIRFDAFCFFSRDDIFLTKELKPLIDWLKE